MNASSARPPEREPVAVEPRAHAAAESATQAILFGMVIFSPWALAGTVPWALWTLNAGGFALGVLWVAKWILRRRVGFRRAAWGGDTPTFLTRLLGGITLALLAWCLLHAANARSHADLARGQLVERGSFIPWLPHSLDGPSSWTAFWTYLGAAGFFWAARDWLLGMSRREAIACDARLRELASSGARSGDNPSRPANLQAVFGSCYPPARLRRLLWVISINTGVLVLVAIFQRLDNTNRLLWLFTDPLGRDARAHLGPFPYRNNGAAFLNLVWPVTFGFWWWQHHRGSGLNPSSRRVGGSPTMVLPFLVILIIAGPMIAESRGGFLVSLAMAAGVLLVIVLGSLLPRGGRMVTNGGLRPARVHLRGVIASALVLLAAALFGGWLGWNKLSDRLFPKRWVLSTGSTELSAVTLRCVFGVAKQPGAKVGGLIGISDSERLMYGRPGAVFLCVRGNRSLEFGVFDAAGKARLFATVPDFYASYLGRDVDVVATCRGTNGALFIDGYRVGNPAASAVRSADVPRRFPAAALWAGALAGGSLLYHGEIKQAALFDGVLADAEIKRLSEARPRITDKDSWTDSLPKPLAAISPSDPGLATWWTATTGSRQSVHRLALSMAGNSPSLLGTGPGTFPALVQLPEFNAPKMIDLHVHSDWIETRVTFGWIGLGLAFLALVTALLAPGRARGIPGLAGLRWFVLIPTAGCLVHATQDFPLQNPAVLLMFLLLLAVLSSLGDRPNPRAVGD